MGYHAADAEITVREDAPDGLRFAVLAIAKETHMSTKSIRKIVCQVLCEPPDLDNWSNYPNIWEEVQRLLQDCRWPKVYDIAEALHDVLSRRQGIRRSNEFEDRLNQYFHEHGIGWKMEKGQITYRGSEVFSGATQEAVEILEQSRRNAAAREIHEALQDISRRPTPDVTGAIQHASAAMEATTRGVMGDSATFGVLAKKLDLPQPLDSATEKLWGYASNNARHGLEGQQVKTPEAELIVSVACAICTYLVSRNHCIDDFFMPFG